MYVVILQSWVDINRAITNTLQLFLKLLHLIDNKYWHLIGGLFFEQGLLGQDNKSFLEEQASLFQEDARVMALRIKDINPNLWAGTE